MPTLNEHPAVVNHGSGVYSSDLADFVRALAEASATRIEGVGDEQYNTGELQKFEVNSVDQYVNELLEELADVMSYLAIITLKILAFRQKADA
jgi:hypothetical protein